MLISLSEFSPVLQGAKCSTIKIILLHWFTMAKGSLCNTETEAFGDSGLFFSKFIGAVIDHAVLAD